MTVTIGTKSGMSEMEKRLSRNVEKRTNSIQRYKRFLRGIILTEDGIRGERNALCSRTFISMDSPRFLKSFGRRIFLEDLVTVC